MFFRTVSASWFWLALRCKNRKELCGDNEFGSCHIQWQLSFTAACVQDVEEKQMTRVSCKRPSLRKTESGNWTLKPTVITSNPNHRNRRAGHYCSPPHCPECVDGHLEAAGSCKTIRGPQRLPDPGGYQLWKCKKCECTFVESNGNLDILVSNDPHNEAHELVFGHPLPHNRNPPG